MNALIEKYNLNPNSPLAAAVRRGIYDEAAVRRFLPETLLERVDARETKAAAPAFDVAAYLEADALQKRANEAVHPRMIVAHTPVRAVTIPSREEHEGIYSCVARLTWRCPVCGGERGEIFETISYDGSRRLHVHGWRNACGHTDKYAAVRKEAATNGLNGGCALAAGE